MTARSLLPRVSKIAGLMAVLAIVACGTRQVRTRAAGSDQDTTPGAAPPPELVVALDWSLAAGRSEPPTTETTEISLSLTDETGATRLEPVGRFPGTCKDVAPPEPRVVLALVCEAGSTGTRLHVVRFGAEIVILRAPLPANGEDPSFEEQGRVTIPIGATVRARQ